MMKARKRFEEPKRFWSKVAVGEVDECWEWQASKTSADYGKFAIHHRLWLAHRVAWVLTFGPIPEGLCVLHKCDNRACCNPYHLFLGTRGDNAADSMKKGRRARKLTEEEVLEIRELYAAGGMTQQELADEFGVSNPTISYITRRKTWNYL